MDRRALPRHAPAGVLRARRGPRPRGGPGAVRVLGPDHLTAFDRRLLGGSSLEAAVELLGSLLIREDAGAGGERRVGRIVEVEAYIGEDDAASHARFGRTARNAVMYGPPGIAYVYLVYGMYDCLNVVTEPAGRPAALLVRAVEPVEGVAAMRAARFRSALRRRSVRAAPERETARLEGVAASRLASGPGLVAAAFSIDREDTGSDLCRSTAALRLEPGPPGPEPVATGPRVGIAYAGRPWIALPWRLWLAGNPAVSTGPDDAGAR